MSKRLLVKGFTLIELLVVIAIIGILSAVVLAALNTARAKGTDAQIKSDLKTIAAQAALDYDTNSGYVASTFTAGTAWNGWPAGAVSGQTAASTGSGAPGTAGVYLFHATAANEDRTASAALAQIDSVNSHQLIWYAATSAFMVEAKLMSAGSYAWCIDSTGKSVSEASGFQTTGC